MQPGFAMLTIQFEDIAEFDQGTVHVPLFQQLEPGLKMFIRTLFRIVAEGQHTRSGKCQKGNLDHVTILASL